ncbi:MAG: PAS domain S-box protein [Alphaproteobacteria bacterium]|nr:PAS domain S-box protein [Alphaproteobacteria bacterium]
MAAINIAAAPRMSGFFADAFSGVVGGEKSAPADRRAAFAAAHILAGCVGLVLWLAHWTLIGEPSDPAVSGAFFWLLMPWALWALVDLFDVDLAIAEAGSAFCLSGLVIYIAAFTGGLTSPVLPWLLVAPMEAAVPGRRAPMLIASGISGVGLLILAAIAFAGIMPASRLTPDMAPTVGAVAMIAALCAVALSVRAIQRRQEQAQDALRDSGALYQLLTDHASDLITRHREDGTILYASPASMSLMGAAPSELAGLSPAMFVHIQDLAEVQRALSLAANGDPQSVQFRLRHKDGSYLVVEMRCQPVEGGIIAVTRDISALKEVEVELKAARDAAEEASRAKSRFLANMSHELRTPLNAIIGFSDIMRQEILGPIGSERYREYAGLIRDSGQHLVDLISDLLDMSKIEAGKFVIDAKPFELGTLIEECMNMVRVTADSAGVVLDRDLAEELPQLIADRRALKQSLINLLSNAIKFTPAEGRVTVAAHNDGDALLLQVKDTGVGIPEKDLVRIGKPFEQVEGELQRMHKGTGLGLSLVKALAELHGGAMRIDSALGDGTTVSLRLPLKAKASASDVVYPERFRAGAGASR